MAAVEGLVGTGPLAPVLAAFHRGRRVLGTRLDTGVQHDFLRFVTFQGDEQSVPDVAGKLVVRHQFSAFAAGNGDSLIMFPAVGRQGSRQAAVFLLLEKQSFNWREACSSRHAL